MNYALFTRRTRLVSRRLVLGALVLAASLLASCGKIEQRGGLMLLIGKDRELRLDEIRVRVFDEAGQELVAQAFPIKEGDLPASLGLANGKPNATVKIRVSGWNGEVPLDVRDLVVTNVPTDVTKQVEVILSAQCSPRLKVEKGEPLSTCEEGTACDPQTGECVGNTLDASRLPDYEEGNEKGVGAGGAGSGGSSSGGTSFGGTDSGGTGGTNVTNPGLGVFGEPCAPEGALACEGNAQRIQLRCQGGKWSSNGTCVQGSHCDTGAENRGLCQPILAVCAGQPEETVVCRDNDVASCGPDEVSTSLVRACEFCELGECYCPAGAWGSSPFAECTPCEAGTFSTTTNAASCAAWSNCAAGTRVDDAGSTTSNRTCSACGPGTYSTTTNAASCAAWSSCAAGTYVAAAGTSTSNRACAACPAGLVSTTTNASACSFAQLAASSAHTCALLTDGNVRCWGAGSAGRLGYGNTNSIGDDETPASAGNVPVGGTVAQLAAGNAHTCALLTDGNVRCWGHGLYGQLGYGNTNQIGDDETPASAGNVPVGGTVAQLAAGNAHTCALLTDGNVRCWGLGDNGRLGYGNTTTIGDNETPASAGNVNVGGTVAQLAAGGSHTCALLTNGNVHCWGLGSQGRLGYGNTNDIGDNETPASAGNVPVGGTVAQLAAGSSHTCALLTDGNVRCWGWGVNGELGYGNTNDIGDNETPASAGNVNVGGAVAQLAAGYNHTCALLTDGNVRCWGLGDNGRLGYGNTTTIGDNETPASAGNVNVGGTVAQLAAGGGHTCALLTNGSVRCWGRGTSGQLGYGNTNTIGDDETPASAGNVPYL